MHRLDPIRNTALLCACALAVCLGTPAGARAQSPYKIAQGDLAVASIGAEAQPAAPVVPKNTLSAVRIVVRTGDHELTAQEVEDTFGPGYQIQAELSGPGLPQAVTLPRQDDPHLPDPLMLVLPPLGRSGSYELRATRLVDASGEVVLDVAPDVIPLRVIEQVLITSVETRPLTRDEIRERGILLDNQAYLGFEFTLAIKLESDRVDVRYPVVFDRQGLPHPPTIPLPPLPTRSVDMPPLPTIVPMMLSVPRAGGGTGGGGNDDDEDDPLQGIRIPSLLVIPGNVGYLKQFFAAQLLVANGAPAGSGLEVKDVTATVTLPAGPDHVPHTDDDPLALPPLETGPAPATLPVKGVGPDGEPGTPDDDPVLRPSEQGRAEFLVRGDQEGFSTLDFDIAATLTGLPTGPKAIKGTAKGGVLVRNPYFDVAFSAPSVVRDGERFKLYATLTNLSQTAANGVHVTLDAGRMSGAHLYCGTPPCNPTVEAGTIPGGDSKTVEFVFDSERTGAVIASYIKFAPGLQGTLNFTLSVGERGVPLSPDTLVLPASLDALPGAVVGAGMRVIGQAWSVARTAPRDLPGQVARTDAAAVQKMALALAEAGLRVQLGQPAATAVRDLAFDFYGGTPLDPGLDQLLRTTEAGQALARALGAQLAAAAGSDPVAYEDAVAHVAASGPGAVTFAVRSTGDPVSVVLTDALGRTSALARGADLPLGQVPGAVFLPLGPPATAAALGVVTAPDHPPYTLTVSGPASVSISFPRGGNRFSRATASVGHAARLLVDFARDEVAIDEDTDGDGDYDDAHSTAAAADFAPEGAHLLSAALVGPETLDGASPLGLQVALLFDRLVDPVTAADKTRYQLPNNGVAAARRQLSGRLVFASLNQPEGPYLPTTITASGVADARGVAGPTATVPLTPRFNDAGAVVSGRVVEADGRPLGGVLVRYSNWSVPCVLEPVMGEVAGVTTGTDGRYQLRYVRRSECGGPFELAVYDPVTGAKRSVSLSVRAAGEQMVADIALLGRGTVTGIVRGGENTPAPGAFVRVVSVTDPTVGALVQADGDGRYVARDITVGAVNVTAISGNQVGQAAGRIERAGGTATVDVRLQGLAARLSGVVYKLENGQTTTVTGVPVLYSLGGQLLGVAYSDGTGHYVLENMPAGNFELVARLNTRDRAVVTDHAEPGQEIVRDLIIEVPPESTFGTVRGTVRLPNGTVAAGTVVTINGRGVLSAGDGTYAITGVPLPPSPQVSNVQVNARTTDGLRTGSAWALLSQAQPIANGIDITLSGLGRVEFTLLGPTGQPISGQSVGLTGALCSAPCGCQPAATDAAGRVSWQVPLGTWGGHAVRYNATPGGDVDVADGSASLIQDGLTAFGVLRMPGFGTVSGSVVDASQNNQPLHGAQVVLTGNRYDAAACGLVRSTLGTRTTDTAGHFDFGAVNAGAVTATATHPIVQGTGWTSGTVTNNQTTALTVRLSSASTMAGELSGHVFLPDGATPAGAGIGVTVNGVVPDVTVHTDAEGLFRFAEVLPAGYYRLTARDPITGGVAGKSIYLQAAQDAKHDLRLLGKGQIVVQVVDGGGRPVDSATVRLRGSDFPNRLYDGAVQSGTEGRAAFDGVVEGPYAIDVSDAFARGARGSVVLGGPDQSVEVKVQLTVVGTVAGHFLMPDNSPIPFGSVRLIAGGRVIGQVTTASSGDVGSYSFAYVPAGPLRLEALDPATGRTGVAVGSLDSEGQTVTLDVRAQALGTVLGIVSSNGAPEPNALVDILSGSYRVSTAVSAAEARYEVAGVPEGRVTVTAGLADGYLKATRSETLLGEGTVLDMDMALRPSGTVEGVVTKADGASPALATVSLWVGGLGGGQFSRSTEFDGTFDFQRIAAGTGTISADELASIDRADATIEVPSGGTVQVPLRLNGVGALRGTARDSGGVATAGFLLVQGSGRYPYTQAVNVGPNGAFAFPELMAGPCTLTLRSTVGGTTLYGSASGVITPGQETTLDVQLQPSGTVTALVLRPGGASGPAMGADVTLTHVRGTTTLQVQPDGHVTFKGVPLGAITLTVVDPVTTGRAVVRGRSVDSNLQIVDLGTVTLDNVKPTITFVDPLDGGTRARLAVHLQADLADDASGVDPSSFYVRYGPFSYQLNGFTFANGRIQGDLSVDAMVVGQNTITLGVTDLAGNLTERTLHFTITGATGSGTVRWSDGTPVPGASVLFWGGGNGPAAIADAQGHYVKTGLRPTFSLQATDPATGIYGYKTALVYDGETTTVDVTMPDWGTIDGIVLRANGSPAAGVTVAAGWSSAITGTDGRFNLGALVLTTYSVVATDAATGDTGRTSVTLSALRQTAHANIQFAGTGHVIVTVRDAQGQLAGQGLLVKATSNATGAGTLYRTTNTSSIADFNPVLAGTITIEAGDASRSGATTGLLTPSGTLNATVTLTGAGTITGHVQYPGGAPVNGATVTISGVSGSVTTNVQGAFTYPSVPLGVRTVKAELGADYASATATLINPGDTVDRTLTLIGSGTVNVEVRDSFGAVAPGVPVTAFSSANGSVNVTGTTGPDGKVALAPLVAGQITIKAQVPVTLQRGQASVALSPGGTVSATVLLEPVGSLHGHILRPDGVTPASGVLVMAGVQTEINYTSWLSLVTGSTGEYAFDRIALGAHTVRVLVGGAWRAGDTLQITANGQVVERDFVLHGAGTVTGLVTYQGQPANGASVNMNTENPYYQSFGAVTGPDGRFTFTNVPVGGFAISADRWVSGLYQRIDATGAVTTDGQTVTANLALVGNQRTLPAILMDGNRMSWTVNPDGGVKGGEVVAGGDEAARLTLTVAGTAYPFVGSGVNGTQEEDGREVVVTQTLAGLKVTRKSFVAWDGYFLRLLDVFENQGSQALTFQAEYSSRLGANNTVPGVVLTSSGDAAASTDDRWLLFDDADATDYFDSWCNSCQFTPFGLALHDAGGLPPSSIGYQSQTLTARWQLTVPAQGRVALMQVLTPQPTRDRGQASAERLAQVPPEALAGMTAAEGAAVANFVVPPDLVGTVPRLPLNDGIITGRVLSADGLTPVPAANLTLRSRSPHYGSYINMGSSTPADGTYDVRSYVYNTQALRPVPRMAFDMKVEAPMIVSSAVRVVPGDFATTSIRDLTAVPGASYAASTSYLSNSGPMGPRFAADRTNLIWQAEPGDNATKPEPNKPFLEVRLPAAATIHEVRLRGRRDGNDGAIRHARLEVRDSAAAVLWSTEVDMPSPTYRDANVPVPDVPGAFAVRVVDLADGGYASLNEIFVMGQMDGAGPSQHLVLDISMTNTAVVSGRITRADNTPVPNNRVTLRMGTNFKISEPSNANGEYVIPVMPAGTYTAEATIPAGGVTVSIPNVVLTAGQRTVRDIQYPAMGSVAGWMRNAVNQPVDGSVNVTVNGTYRNYNVSGTYRIDDLTPGTYTINASRNTSGAVMTANVTVVANATTTQNFTFPPVGIVQVHATVEGQPLVSGQVWWQTASRGPDWIFQGYTSAAGLYTLTNTPGPDVNVKVVHPNSNFATGQGSVTLSEGQTVTVDIAVPGVGGVTGVLRTRNGVALAGQTVRVLPPSGTTYMSSQTTTASGGFSFTNVPVGSFRLQNFFAYGTTGLERAQVTGTMGANGQTVSLDALAPRGALGSGERQVWNTSLAAGQSVVIRLAGEAVGPTPALGDPYLEVYAPDGTLAAANDNKSATDLSSEVTFTAAQTGNYLVVARPAAGTGGYRLYSSHVEADSVVFTLYVGTTVTGVVSAEGTASPVANATVRLTAVVGALTVTRTTTTNELGQYTFNDVLAGATLTASVLDADGTALASATATSGAAGTTATIGLVRPYIGAVQVSVLRGAEVFSGINVTVTSDNAYATEALKTQQKATDVAGHAAFSRVPAGAITAQAPDPGTGNPMQATGTLADGDTLALVLTVAPNTDVTPPAAVTLTASLVGAGGRIHLAWTAPGDDGNTGTAAAYDLRYLNSPITTDNFTQALPVVAPAPAPAGTAQSLDVDVPTGQTFSFALMTRDEGYNWSPLSNVVTIDSGLPAAGLKLWLKADAGVTADGSEVVSAWADQSGNGNNATQATAGYRPVRVPGAANGLPVLRFDGTDDALVFTTRLTTVRTVFWVVKESATTDAYRFLLGDTSNYDFHSGYQRQMWDPGYSNAAVRGGETRVNGNPIDGTVNNTRPTSLSVVSLVTTANVAAASFCNDRTYGRQWKGDLAEMMIYDRLLNADERRQVEDYLTAKWATGPVARRAPGISPNGGLFAEPVTVRLGVRGTGLVRYTLDGTDPASSSALFGSPFVVTPPVTVKARAYAAAGTDPSPVATATFLSSGQFTPASVTGLKLWVRADAGVSGGPSVGASAWTDQSGLGNTMVQPLTWGQPVIVPNGAGTLPVLRFDGLVDALNFTTRLTTIRTVFWVVKDNATTNGYRFLLGDNTNTDFNGGLVRQIWDAGSASSLVTGGQLRLNSGSITGTTASRPLAMSVLSLVTNGNTVANSFSTDRNNDRSWWGDLAELIVYDQPLSNTDRRAVEEYLAARYGITLVP